MKDKKKIEKGDIIKTTNVEGDSTIYNIDEQFMVKAVEDTCSDEDLEYKKIGITTEKLERDYIPIKKIEDRIEELKKEAKNGLVIVSVTGEFQNLINSRRKRG